MSALFSGSTTKKDRCAHVPGYEHRRQRSESETAICARRQEPTHPFLPLAPDLIEHVEWHEDQPITGWIADYRDLSKDKNSPWPIWCVA